MSVHIGEISSQITVGGAAEPAADQGEGGQIRLPRWTELERQRRLQWAADRQQFRTRTGERHD